MAFNIGNKPFTSDAPKMLAISSYVASLCLWFLAIWAIATQNRASNSIAAFIENFLNYKEHLDVLLFVAIAIFFLLIGTYFLQVSKKENKRSIAKKQKESSVKNSDYDELTGLLNRDAFEKRVTGIIKKTNTKSTRHALLIIGIDRMKIVNNTAGQSAGDALLSQVSKLLQNKLHKRDIVARLFGDEFIILLRNCGQNEAMERAQILIETIDAFQLNWGEKQLTVGATGGFVMIEDNKISFSNILGRASSACHSAKKNNRGNVVKYSQAHAASYQDMRISMQIKCAIEEDQFVLYHQRILNIRENDTGWQSSEILIRMKGEEDNDNKVLTPGIFLPIAERYNMMKAIDRWVINNLFQYIYDRQKQLLKDKQRFYINLSGDSLNDENFCDFLTDKIKQFNIATKLLCFEITETIAIQNLQNAAYLIGYLKRLGCSFALDDFGTGTSSFAYLKYLPIDYLKIDGIFIKDIANDPVDYEIVKAIKNICKTMKIKTIAELVEDEKTINFLKQLEIDFVQGHAIQKPIPLIN